MAHKTVDVQGLGVVKLHKRRGVHSLKLSVSPDGLIRVSMPFWVPYSAGAEFARNKREWILGQLPEQRILSNGDLIGKTHRLEFVTDNHALNIRTRITSKGQIRVLYPAHQTFSDKAVQSAAHKASLRALKQQSEKILPVRLRSLATDHGFSYKNVRIKQLKSRWGSCSSDKEIVLNSFLVQLPWHLIDYVLLHELVHTRIMAHGNPFWTELSKYVPNLKSVRREIKSHKPFLLTE